MRQPQQQQHSSNSRLPLYLPAHFGALGNAGGAQRVALGDEATGRVDYNLAAVRVVTSVNKRTSLALVAQAQSLVGDELQAGGRGVSCHKGGRHRGMTRGDSAPKRTFLPRWQRSSRAARRRRHPWR